MVVVARAFGQLALSRGERGSLTPWASRTKHASALSAFPRTKTRELSERISPNRSRNAKFRHLIRALLVSFETDHQRHGDRVTSTCMSTFVCFYFTYLSWGFEMSLNCMFKHRAKQGEQVDLDELRWATWAWRSKLRYTH